PPTPPAPDEDTNQDWEEWKKLCEHQPTDLNLSQWKNVVDSIATDWTGSVKGKTEVCGYLEGSINQDGDTVIAGKLKLKTSLSAGLQAQYTIGVVPIYAKVSIGAEGSAEGALAYNWTQKKLDGQKSGITLSIEPFLAAEAGVGVMAVASVGVEGKGSLPVSTKLGSRESLKVSLKGTLSLKAKLLMFEYSLKLAEREKTLLPREETAALSALSMDEFELSDDSYTERESLWLGEDGGLQAFSLETSEKGCVERVLKTNINPDADTQLIDAGGTKMILWTEGDSARAAVNNSKLVYSLYDPQKDAWSEPLAVADDGTADYAPAVATDGMHIYVAWQNINEVFDDQAGLADVAAASEIVLSVWTAGQGFSEPKVVSESGAAAVLPKVALDGDGSPYVVYLQNTDNNLLLNTGTNRIQCAAADGGAVRRQTLVEDAGLVTALDTAYADGCEVSYTVDTDGDLSTLDDREIVGTGTAASTQNGCMDSNAQYVENGGRRLRFWYQDGRIVMSDGSGAEQAVCEDETGALTDDFHVVSGQAGQLAVVWTAVDGAGNRQIEGCLYDSEEDRWSRSIRISDTDAGVFRPRGIFTQDGKLEFLYRKTGAERTDLCLLTAAPSVDLALVHAYCDETALEPGQTAKVRVQVRNQGTKSADGYTVAVAGTKTVISEILAPGEETVVEADYPVPEELTCQEIAVTAEADGDVDESNNRFDLAVGHTDLVMNLLSDCYEFGHLAEIRVANESCVDTEAVLEIHKGRRDGELVKRIDLGVLRRGEVTTVTYLWNELTENYSQETPALFFDVIAEKPEKYTDNNYDFMVTGTGNVELPEEAALMELTVSKEKTQYRPGDVLNIDDLTVTAGYSDGTSRPVTGYTTNASELDLSAEGTKTLTVTYQENGVTKEASVEIVVKAGSSVDVPGTCTVTFDVQGHGTAPEAQTGIGLGEKVREPERPAADGYLFTGWYRGAECTVKWDFTSDTVEGDMTLYAGWIQQEPDPDREKAAAPTADVPSGSEVTEGTRVVLSTVTDGAAIYYTTDGSTPARDSLLYKDAIVIEHTVTIRAIAVKEGYEDSEIAEFTYSVKQEMQDWGDLTEEDRALYNNPSEIPENFWLAGIPEHAAYTGKAVTFAVRVYDHKTLLAEKTDYTISYKNNKNAADASKVPASKAPAVIIKGRNNFTGTITRTFTILPADIGGDGFRAEDVYRFHTGKVQKAPAVLYQNGRALKKGRDYVLSYEDTGKNAYTGAGSWKITITGRGNYTGTRTVQEVIGTGTLMSRAKVSPVKAQEYTGEAICPVPEVTHGGKKLTGMEASRYETTSAQERAAVDYLYTYADNREAGSARLILTGVNDYFGQAAKTFQITGTPLARCTLSGFENTFVYTGAECTQDAVFTAPAGSGKSGMLTGMPAEAYEAADAAARAGVDYTYEYQNHTKAGRAAVIYRGVNGYSGTLKKTYRIAAYDLKEDSGGRITVAFDASVPYAKGGAGPEPVVTFRYGGTSRVLTAGTDYTVCYVNHKAVSGSSGKRPELLIQGRGNFTGKRLAGTFSVVPQDIGTLAMTVQDVAYKKKANIYRSALTVTDRNGKKLAAGTDYEKTAAYEYAEDTAVLQRVNGKDTEILRRAGDPVDAKDIIPAGARLRVTVTGRKNYSGTLSAVFRFTESSLAGAKVTVSAQYYTGRAVEPDRDQITVKVGGTALRAEDYEIIGYANNRKKGTAQVTIRGIGNYGGTKTVNFRIQSRVMSITVRPGGKSISSGRENRAGILTNPSEFLIET
ncbi:MAG: chitobiase/beta-hexosaminidase C-terminal domain-containing protein, partial [Lachnospiraceae bacterium]